MTNNTDEEKEALADLYRKYDFNIGTMMTAEEVKRGVEEDERKRQDF